MFSMTKPKLFIILLRQTYNIVKTIYVSDGSKQFSVYFRVVANKASKKFMLSFLGMNAIKQIA